MVNKKFDQEVSGYQQMSNRVIREEKRQQFFLETEPGLADRLRKAMKIAGNPYAGNHVIGSMIGRLKRYQSAEFGYSFKEAVTAMMWKQMQYDSDATKPKVEKAIKFLIDYRPQRADWVIAQKTEEKKNSKEKWIEFKNNHRALIYSGYFVWCLLIFIGMFSISGVLTGDAYWRVFIAAMSTYTYVVFTWDSLKK